MDGTRCWWVLHGRRDRTISASPCSWRGGGRDRDAGSVLLSGRDGHVHAHAVSSVRWRGCVGATQRGRCQPEGGGVPPVLRARRSSASAARRRASAPSQARSSSRIRAKLWPCTSRNTDARAEPLLADRRGAWWPRGLGVWAAGSVCRGGVASAAGESTSALGVRRGVVELEVVVERRLVGLGELLAVLLDVRRGLDLRFGNGYL